MKSLVGDNPKILNDMVGSATVSAWREQAERAAVRLCGETGRMMLHGTFPSIRLDTLYDKQLLIDTLMGLFKRSSKKWSTAWISDNGGDANITLALRLGDGTVLCPPKSQQVLKLPGGRHWATATTAVGAQGVEGGGRCNHATECFNVMAEEFNRADKYVDVKYKNEHLDGANLEGQLGNCVKLA
eukprot:g7112.t1